MCCRISILISLFLPPPPLSLPSLSSLPPPPSPHRVLPLFLKVVQKLHKEHISTTPTTPPTDVQNISELLQLGLDMCKTRISMMPQESRKAFINIMTNVIEKSTDTKLLRVITKIVEEWVKSKVCV